jgi:hypothetical protein
MLAAALTAAVIMPLVLAIRPFMEGERERGRATVRENS